MVAVVGTSVVLVAFMSVVVRFKGPVLREKLRTMRKDLIRRHRAQKKKAHEKKHANRKFSRTFSLSRLQRARGPSRFRGPFLL